MTSTRHPPRRPPSAAPAARRGRRTPCTARLRAIAAAARLLNPVMRSLAGRQHVALFAQVRHCGRRTGRAYITPVTARPTADGFVVPLTFGEGSDWIRNVLAAGGCVIRWDGVDYSMADPEVIDWATARPAFTPIERALIPVIGIERFVRLRHAPARP